MKAALTLTQRPRLRALLESAKAPDETQLRVLRGILADNASTTFGTEHRFSGINTVAEYRRAVPVQVYEDLRELVERQELTGEPCLTAERPVF
ncbi:MAG: GH3 auxin-responsive promoter family protein, partial [Acidimicrobiia bacterium]|nr:GH3 auxin-responsive promoter family protein [Acidimicrobiia bacterium]